MAMFELSSKKYKNGRRPFTAILYELQPPECVVDDVGTKFNQNGITFLEEYCAPQLDSIKDMSITVSFLDDERTQICDHGDTGIIDGLPVFDNATVVGHFTEGFITDIQKDGETKRVVAGKGYLDEMRYHAFVSSLEQSLQNGETVEGSIEIYKSEGNNSIIYKNGNLPQGRIPTEFIHSGFSLVLCAADSTATLLELNNQNKEAINKMEFDMNEIKKTITDTMVELNNKETQFETKVAELNAQLEAKDAVIAENTNALQEKENSIVELNATIEQVRKALQDMETERDAWWAERDALQKQVGELKAKERLGELNTAIKDFTDEEQKFAESEINSFKENPIDGDVEAIVSKIYAGIGQASKQASVAAQVAEMNSAKNVVLDDIFAEMNSVAHVEDKEDINIF